MKKAQDPGRQRLPNERESVTRSFELRGIEDGESLVYEVVVIVGLYSDGQPGEIFLRVGRGGSLASGAFDALALVMSMALQHGVPLRTMLDKMRGMRFDPAGATGDEEIGIALSIPDAVAKWMLRRFCGEREVVA